MIAIKSHTDLVQSKKLAEILRVESADMHYDSGDECEICFGRGMYEEIADWICEGTPRPADIPCWSLTALLSVLPFHIIANNQGYAFSMHKGLNKDGETYMVRYNVFNTDVCLYETEYYNNPIDACYEMIIKLHELKKK